MIYIMFCLNFVRIKMALFTKLVRRDFSVCSRLLADNNNGMVFDLYARHTRDPAKFKSVKYWVDNRVAHVQLNRPERLNAIDLYMPIELQTAIEQANNDQSVKVILLYGANKTFCSGYDLKLFAESGRDTQLTQQGPYDPYKDFAFMGKCTECLMSIWRSLKPVVCKIQGFAVGGGSDMALTADVIFMSEDARIGYPPVRVWGSPTTAMWLYRVGLEKAKRIMFTGDLLSGAEAAKIGLVGEAVPEDKLDQTVDKFVRRMCSIPTNQLFFQKQVLNNAVEMMGLLSTQRLATLMDGMTRHTPEGLAFQDRAQQVGFKQAVKERDSGDETPWSNL